MANARNALNGEEILRFELEEVKVKDLKLGPFPGLPRGLKPPKPAVAGDKPAETDLPR